MNDQLRKFYRLSGLDIYGLGKDREKWEAAIDRYTEFVIRECGCYLLENEVVDIMDVIGMEDHFKGK